MVIVTTKVCTKCKRELPLTSFGKHRYSKDGHDWRCKECGRKHAKMWSVTPSGVFSRIQARANYYRTHHPNLYKPMEISKEDFITWYINEPKVCAYCDILEEHLGLIHMRFDKRVTHLSIDCRDNNKGYSLDNLALACNLCNLIKKNIFTFDEMRDIAQRHIKPKWMAQAQTANREVD